MSIILKDVFNLLIFLLLVTGLLDLFTFSLHMPFSVLCGALLYRAHRYNLFKTGGETYLVISVMIFIVLCVFRIYLLVNQVPLDSLLSGIYFISFLLLSGLSLIVYPLKIYMTYKNKYTVQSARTILLNQLSVISIFCGLTTLLMLIDFHYSIDFDISPLHVLFTLISLTIFLKSMYLVIESRKHSSKTDKRQPSVEESLSEEMAIEYGEKLNKVLSEKTLYLRPDFSLEMLSHHTEIPKYRLSQYFNQHLHMSFYQYIAAYRIQYALKIMDSHKANYTVEALAYACGFNSVTTFNKYFKEEVGCSPHEYRNKTLKL